MSDSTFTVIVILGIAIVAFMVVFGVSVAVGNNIENGTVVKAWTIPESKKTILIYMNGTVRTRSGWVSDQYFLTIKKCGLCRTVEVDAAAYKAYKVGDYIEFLGE